MVRAYWEIGKQKGQKKAEYGTYIIKELSIKLTKDFGKGFTETNLRYMRQFYSTYQIGHTLCDELTWSHYRILMKINDSDERTWYQNEAIEQNWSVRALKRQINSLYYKRLLASKDKKPVIEEARKKTIPLKQSPEDILKDPYILEFLNLNDKSHFRESKLESRIIEKLQEFLLELGKGFAFVARQKRISTETKEFYIDLVFYNYYLKCFVLVDLKTSELSHQDIGQMDMYIRMFDDLQRQEGDNPTVGLILCTDKDKAIVKYSFLEESKQLFASTYMLYLPKEEELKAEIEREKRLIELELEKED
jgi:predicted nuclease of restriction endonuclease-like (RecB) superfamily